MGLLDAAHCEVGHIVTPDGTPGTIRCRAGSSETWDFKLIPGGDTISTRVTYLNSY